MNRRAYKQACRLCANDPDGRRIVENAIEALLAALDEADGDPDLEPSLGAPESHPVLTLCLSSRRDRSGDQKTWASGGRDDREDDPAELGIADDGGLSEQLAGVL